MHTTKLASPKHVFALSSKLTVIERLGIGMLRVIAESRKIMTLFQNRRQKEENIIMQIYQTKFSINSP